MNVVWRNNLEEELGVFPLPSGIPFARSDLPKDQINDGTIAMCHTQTAVEDKHWYLLLLSTAMVRSALPLLCFLIAFAALAEDCRFGKILYLSLRRLALL